MSDDVARYVTCPGCGEFYSLTRAGRTRKHYVKPRSRRVECSGTGSIPEAAS